MSWNDTTEKRGLEMPCFTVGFVVEEFLLRLRKSGSYTPPRCKNRLRKLTYPDYLLPPTTICYLPSTK